ncbi:MAG: cold shock domain-containing protein [Acidimicrobiales bacterium]|jgi:cold shock CspA family protein
MVRGIVETFDERRGDGIIRSDRGERLYFHCVSIADGSRQIDPGARVEARRRVGHVGRDEVVDVTTVSE